MISPPPVAKESPAVAELHEASKWYGDVIGLNQVSLKIQPGITGLLGPNGAGKSTFLKLLTGQLRASRGSVRVFGLDPWSNPQVYRQMSYSPDSEQLYEEMSGREFVVMMARLSGFSAAEAARRADEQLERVSMSQHSRRLARGYSKGMRQRTRLAAALLHDPKLIVLDEPLNGLDPMGRLEMLNLFRQLASEGRSVIVSSHILHEIQNLTRRMVMLHHGRVLAEGEISEVRTLIERQPLTLKIASTSPRSVAAFLVGLESVTSVEFVQPASQSEQPGLVVRSNNPDTVFEALQSAVVDNKAEVSSIEALDDNLDAIFHYLTGQQS